ncbi:MAG: hypothetical protein U5N56_01975 [Candidatus Marinimicrobia bacterium]|nr:hypothetical protein [Candidatus Neomarinimicrobiota bacterium]
MKEIFSAAFWNNLIGNTMTWVTKELPSLLIVIIIAFVSFKMIKILFKKLRKSMVARAEKMRTLLPQRR